MVEGTKEAAVGHGGLPAEEPRNDVMRLGPARRTAATREGAALVSRMQGTADGTRHHPLGASHIQDFSTRSHQHRDDSGIAGRFPNPLHRNGAAVLQQRRSHAVPELLKCNRQEHLRNQATVVRKLSASGGQPGTVQNPVQKLLRPCPPVLHGQIPRKAVPLPGCVVGVRGCINIRFCVDARVRIRVRVRIPAIRPGSIFPFHRRRSRRPYRRPRRPSRRLHRDP